MPVDEMKAVWELTGLSMDDKCGPDEQQKFMKCIANAKANSNTVFSGMASEWTGLSVIPQEYEGAIPDEFKDLFDLSTIVPEILTDLPTLNYGRT